MNSKQAKKLRKFAKYQPGKDEVEYDRKTHQRVRRNLVTGKIEPDPRYTFSLNALCARGRYQKLKKLYKVGQIAL